MKLWGIDLGGTKIEGVIFDDESSATEPLVRVRIPTEADKGYIHIIEQIHRLVDHLHEESRTDVPQIIGIGTPGAKVHATGLMKNCNTTCLNGKDLEGDIQKRIGTRVKIANDADCFALAEALLGAGKDHKTVFGVILGTGVGGGIVSDGRLLQGPNGLTGEWGHMTLVPDGLPCYCGRRGCVENYLSGPSVEAHHLQLTGVSKKLEQIASSKDSSDCMTIDWMCEKFGQALAQVVNFLDPDIIILGGGTGQVPQLRHQGINELRKNVFGRDFMTPIVLPALGDSAGVFGAALLCL